MLKRNKGSQANNGCVEGCWEKWGRHWGTLKQGKGIQGNGGAHLRND